MSTRRKGPTPRKAVAPSRPAPRSASRLAARVLAVAVTVVVLAVAIFGIRLWTGVTRVSIAAPGAGGGATNYLLVGSDSRSADAGAPAPEGAGERADMVMVLHVPAPGSGSGSPTLLTVPRDTLVPFPGLPGTHRLTLALTKGPQNLVDTLCHAFGLGIDHVTIVNFEGFRSLVDLVGGIDLDFPTPTRDFESGLDVSAGRQHLDGTQSLALVRSRHTQVYEGDTWYPAQDGAERRVHTAGDVLHAISSPAAAMAGSLPGKVRLASALRGNVTVDDAMGRDDVDHVLAALRAAQDGPPESRREVPVVHVDGDLPTATLTAGAREVLESVGAGSSSACPTVATIP